MSEPKLSDFDAALAQLNADMDASAAEAMKLSPEERMRRWAETLAVWVPKAGEPAFFGLDDKPALKAMELYVAEHEENGRLKQDLYMAECEVGRLQLRLAELESAPKRDLEAAVAWLRFMGWQQAAIGIERGEHLGG